MRRRAPPAAGESERRRRAGARSLPRGFDHRVQESLRCSPGIAAGVFDCSPRLLWSLLLPMPRSRGMSSSSIHSNLLITNPLGSECCCCLNCTGTPGQWYTLLGVLTQTWPAPGVARSLLVGAGGAVVGWDGALTGPVVAGAAPHDCKDRVDRPAFNSE
jgi:hypothetical protein